VAKIDERDIKKKIRKYLNTLPASKFVSYNPYPNGEAGTPDYIGCFQGLGVVIEVKAPGKDLSDIQKVRRREWRDEAGAFHIVAYSTEDVQRFFREFDITEEKVMEHFRKHGR